MPPAWNEILRLRDQPPQKNPGVSPRRNGISVSLFSALSDKMQCFDISLTKPNLKLDINFNFRFLDHLTTSLDRSWQDSYISALDRSRQSGLTQAKLTQNPTTGAGDIFVTKPAPVGLRTSHMLYNHVVKITKYRAASHTHVLQHATSLLLLLLLKSA